MSARDFSEVSSLCYQHMFFLTSLKSKPWVCVRACVFSARPSPWLSPFLSRHWARRPAAGAAGAAAWLPRVLTGRSSGRRSRHSSLHSSRHSSHPMTPPDPKWPLPPLVSSQLPPVSHSSQTELSWGEAAAACVAIQFQDSESSQSECFTFSSYFILILHFWSSSDFNWQ